MYIHLGYSKGNEENPREIRAEKIEHSKEIASFAVRGTLSVGTFGIAAITALAIALSGLFLVLGIVFQALSAF